MTTDKDKSSYDTDFYRQNLNYNKYLVDLWKIFSSGVMYWYKSDLANKMRKEYEKSYKEYLKMHQEFYNNLYKNYKL